MSMREHVVSNPRVLGVVRLSVTREDTTSPERQRAAVEHWSAGPAVGGTVVGWAEDLDVSGGLDPFKRPALGAWLSGRVDEFDVIAVWKLDRLTRRSMHFSQLIEWCQEHGKTIVSVTEGIDMSTPMGKMFAQIIAAFAEGELDTIRARAEAGARTRLEKGVWVGGVEPFGYLFESQPDGGKRLVQEPGYAALLRDMVAKLNDDWSSYKIAVDLNARGVLTWRDRLRELRGEQPRKVAWNSTTVLAILKNPTLGGLYTYKGQLVEDPEGNPVKITDDPILSFAEWSEIVARINERKEAKPVRAAVSRTMLGGVAVCHCGARMSSAKKAKPGKKVYHYYSCNSLQTGLCAAPAVVRKEDLDVAVSSFVLDVLGSRQVLEKVPGLSAEIRQELADTKARLLRLEARYQAGDFDGDGQEESFLRMHGPLSAKVGKLSKLVAEDPGPKYRATGQTYRSVWEGKDEDQRREFLQRHGIEIKVSVLSPEEMIEFLEDPAETRKGVGVSLRLKDLPGIGMAEGLGDSEDTPRAEEVSRVTVIQQRKRGQG